MMTRRSLIELAALGTAVAVASPADASFALPKLPYAYDALEPFIDALTMQIHHEASQAYVDNLNRAVATDARLSKLSVEELLQRLNTLPASIRTQVRNQGGHANHTLFWQILTPAAKSGKPSGTLNEALNRAFGGQAKFEEQLKARRSEFLAAAGHGYRWIPKANWSSTVHPIKIALCSPNAFRSWTSTSGSTLPISGTRIGERTTLRVFCM